MHRRVKSVAFGVASAAMMSMGQTAQAQMPGALEECLKLAGEPTAEAPVSRAAGSATFSALAKARPHCEAALIGPEQDPQVLFHMAVIMQREGFLNYALRAVNLSASGGVAPAFTKVGDYYNFGIGGIRENHRRAVENYAKAAEAGDLPAKATLAIMHQIGRGVPQDFDKMFSLLEEPADAGYHFSQLRLAELYMCPDAVSPAPGTTSATGAARPGIRTVPPALSAAGRRLIAGVPMKRATRRSAGSSCSSRGVPSWTMSPAPWRQPRKSRIGMAWLSGSSR